LQAGSHVTIIYQNTEQKKPDCSPTPPPCTPKPDCSPTPPPCTPKPDCSPTPPPCTPKPDCRPQDSCKDQDHKQPNHNKPNDPCNDSHHTKHPNTKAIEENSTNPQEETDDTPSSTPPPSDENKSTNSGSSSSTTASSSSTSTSSKTTSNAAPSNSGVTNIPVASPVPVLPAAKDPLPSVTQFVSEGSVMFGLGWLGAALVVLFGAIVTALAITAIHLTHKKRAPQLQL
ncbi:MAG: hypothetical protein FWE73_05155, partial [Candidatus Bathyarchaeota archaeon]|nr:hypothetical protein [Candidatus Termitimicrobium sp.]MCL2685765.1 hypothetical protein [Candidatus Termitimicrobium sp.]